MINPTFRFAVLAPGALLAARAAETPVVLSPFEVNTGRDLGFVASSSLAGGRLAGDLKDTAIAMTVSTRDFIDALARTTQWRLTTPKPWLPLRFLSPFARFFSS